MSSKVSAAAVVYLSTVAPPPPFGRARTSLYTYTVRLLNPLVKKEKKNQKGIDLPYRLYYSPIVRRHCSGSVYVSMALLVLTFRIT